MSETDNNGYKSESSSPGMSRRTFLNLGLQTFILASLDKLPSPQNWATDANTQAKQPDVSVSDDRGEQSGQSITEQVVLANCEFPQDPNIQSSGGEYRLYYSTRLLNELGITSVTASVTAADQATQHTFRDMYAAAGLPPGSELAFSAFQNTTAEIRSLGESISGTIESITQFAVTPDEFEAVVTQLESLAIPHITYSPSGNRNRVTVVGYFEDDGRFIAVNKPRGLLSDSPERLVQNLIFDGPVAAHGLLVNAAAMGQHRFRQLVYNADHIYYDFGCTEAHNWCIGTSSPLLEVI